MHNFFSPFSRTSTSDTGSTRVQNTRRRRGQRHLLVAGAIIAVGGIVGNGLVLQPALAAQNERISATAALAASTGLPAEQLDSYDGVLHAHAEKNATVAISAANVVMTAAKGKTDTTVLSASVASLTHFTLLPPERVFDLVDKTTAETAQVRAATVRVNRVAARQSAAAAAAQAAAQAAAEKAAAEKAAAAQAAAAKTAA